MTSTDAGVEAPLDVPSVTAPFKVLVCGGWASGKTTFVGSVSEIVPITTESPMTSVSVGIDIGGVATKVATTVAVDFGRTSTQAGPVAYLFGTPGQTRFRFAWDQVAAGASGAVIVVDTRRLDGAFPSVDFCESRSIPFVVAVNRFDGVLAHDLDDVRDALVLGPEPPILGIDARSQVDCDQVLDALMRYALPTRQ